MSLPRSLTGDPASAPDASIDRLVLTGFMGSGKTTVGRLLAARLNWRFVDLDDEIVRRHEMSVAEIFAQHGEAVFRSAETEALRSFLGEPHIVLALGGGAIETAVNREMLQTSPHTLVVLLTAPFATLYQRCLAQQADPSAAARPLLGDAASAEDRLSRRHQLYRAAARVSLDTMGQTPEQSVESVLQALRSTL